MWRSPMGRPSGSGTKRQVMRWAFMSATASSARASGGIVRGARVMTISPDAASRVAMGTNLMDSEPRSRVIAAGLSQGRAVGLGHDG